MSTDLTQSTITPALAPRYSADMSPATWTKDVPRIGVSVRVYPEYRTALDTFTASCQAAGMTALQRYDVLEFLMADLLTDAGRRALVRRIAERPLPRRQKGARAPRGMLSARIRPEYMEGLQATLDAALDIDLVTLERYHVLEYLLAPLLTDEGQMQTLDALLQQRPG